MKEQRGDLIMSIWKCFQMAMSSIVGNKMRSILTMLGIIIGITAVIALVSLMSGMTSEITDTFEEMGIESINVIIKDRQCLGTACGRTFRYYCKSPIAQCLHL